MMLTITFDIDKEHRHSTKFEIASDDLENTERLEKAVRTFLLHFLNDTKSIREHEEANET